MDTLYFWSQVAGAFFVVLALIAGRVVNNQQSRQILSLQKDVSDAKTRQAEAETKLEEVRKKQEPRQLDLEKFSNALKGKAPAEVEILYQPDDKEAYVLANMTLLGLVGGGWVSGSSFIEPIPIPEDSSSCQARQA